MTRKDAIEAIKCNWPDSRYTILREALDMAISALRQQETVANRNGLNEPLTLDELRKMDGEPVWVVYGEDAGMWALVEVCEESIFLTNNLGGRTEYAANVELEDDGITVYRQKPEEEDKHEAD